MEGASDGAGARAPSVASLRPGRLPFSFSSCAVWSAASSASSATYGRVGPHGRSVCVYAWYARYFVGQGTTATGGATCSCQSDV